MMNEIKGLPRNEHDEIKREFTANGKKFIIRSPNEGIGIYRFSKMEDMGGVLGFDASFKSLVKSQKKYEEIYHEDIPASFKAKKMLLNSHAVLDGITSAAKNRYAKAFFMCTLFIVRPEEDLTKWNQDYSQAKIDDWNAAGLNEQDFLDLALNILPGFISAYKQQNKKMISLEEKRTNLMKKLNDSEPLTSAT